MKLKTKIGVWKARRNAERELGFKISDEEAKEILNYCIRKLSYIKKDESYLPLLLRVHNTTALADKGN